MVTSFSLSTLKTTWVITRHSLHAPILAPLYWSTIRTDALYSDNPGLWDIQFSSWVFCESNVKVMSLIKSASSWFQRHHTNYAKIASAADFRSPHSSDQLRFLQASGHHPRTSDQATGYSCDRPRTHAIAYDKRSLTDRQRFSLSLGCFPHKEKWLDTHTQCDSCDDERRFRLPGYDFCMVQPFSA